MPIDHQNLLSAAKQLEPLPPTVARLTSLLTRADWEMDEVEECIALDQALTPRLLRIVNSAFWFRGHAIGTVREAVMRVGSGTVMGLVMGVAVKQRLARAVPRCGLHEGELWTHSVASALAATMLDTATDARLPSEAFAAALLHDVGKLLVARLLENEPRPPFDGPVPPREASGEDPGSDAIGFDHAELGGVVALQWQLSERLVTGIVHHHTPAATADPIASVVHVADVIAHRAELLAVLRRTSRPALPSPEALDRLCLRDSDLDRLATEVGDKLTDVLRRYA